MKQKLKDAVDFIKKHLGQQFSPKIALILGSGLGDFADTFDNAIKIPTDSIPHFPVSTVEGHKGFLVFGFHKNTPLMAVQGRTHFYEGYKISEVSFVVEIIAELGIKYFIVTNAAGSTNRRIAPGDLMLITDHVNFLYDSPLREDYNFTDMSNPYSTDLSKKIEDLALEKKIKLKKGVLWTSSGPTYETAAEIKMISKFGGDAVSMSTVPEVIMANRLKIKTVGISCITNYATGIGPDKLSHDEVTETAERVKRQFIAFVSLIITEVFNI